jgi:hypothetical protein
VDTVTETAANAVTSPFGTLVSIIPMLIVTVLAAIIWVLGKLIIIIIGMVIIPILGYNNFAHSNIISIGWPLVRDVVNMLFILYLLYIAIRTILGLEKSWQDQIVKLFLAAIGVNFSRTICLIVIDFGQVVMFTFVDAIRDIAAGNFINLFQISSFQSLSQAAIDASGNAGFNSIGYLGASYAVVVFLSMVLAVMLLMAVIFIYRIVILWILIIMSPIAFFLMAMGSGKAGEWKSKFTDFDFGIANEIFQIDKLLSLFMALVIIMVGFQVSSSYAKDLGGVAAEYVNGKTAQKWVKGAAAMPAALGYKAVREGVRQVDRRMTDKDGNSVFSLAGGDLIRESGKLRQYGALGRVAADALGSVGGKVQKTSADSRKDARKAAEKRVEDLSDGEKQERMRAMAAGQAGAILNMSRDDQDYVRMDYMKNKTTRDEFKEEAEKRAKAQHTGRLEASGAALGLKDETQKEIDKFEKDLLSNVGARKGSLVTEDKDKAAWLKFQSGRLHMLETDEKDAAGNVVINPATGKPNRVADTAAMKKIIEDKDFDPRNLSAASIKDPRVGQTIIGLLDQQTAGVDTVDGKPVTRSIADFAESGRGVSAEVRDAMRGERSVASRVLQTRPDPAAGGAAKPTMSVEDLAKAFKDGRMNITQLTDAHMTGRGADVVKAVIDSKIQIDPAQLAALAASGPDGAAAHAKFTAIAATQLDTNRAAAKTDPQRAAIDAKILAITGDAQKAYGYSRPAPGASGEFLDASRGGKQKARESFTQSVKNDVQVINNITMAAGNTHDFTDPGSHMSQALVDAGTGIKKDDLDRFAEQARVGDAATKLAVKNALDTISKMMEAHGGGSVGGAPPTDPRLAALKSQADSIISVL